MSKLKVLFLYPNLMLQTGFPMAICTFSAILKQEGFDVELFDTTFYTRQKKLLLMKREWKISRLSLLIWGTSSSI